MQKFPLDTLLNRSLSDQYAIDFIATMNAAPTIEQIDNNKYVDFPEIGVSLVANASDNITTIQIYSGEQENFSYYIHLLPSELTLDSSRTDVREHLGDPTRSGGDDTTDSSNEASRSWDLYNQENYTIHFEYTNNNGSISLMSVMSNLE